MKWWSIIFPCSLRILLVAMSHCLIFFFFFFFRDLKMGMKRHTCGWVGWGQDHQTVSTNVKAAYLVILFKHPQPLIRLEFNMPIMCLKDGNASVAHLSLILKNEWFKFKGSCTEKTPTHFYFLLRMWCWGRGILED